MTWIAGVDGCPKGWFRICRETETGALVFDCVTTPQALWASAPRPVIVAVDMPIGLPEAGGRACDQAARTLLGPRRGSVFPAPVRAAVSAASREEASRITTEVDGRGVAAQAFGLYRKIEALDRVLPTAGVAVHEVHPEVSFSAWNGGAPLAHAKKKPEGKAERLALVESWLGPDFLLRARGDRPRREVADDDLLDAAATLWTAHRIFEGTAIRLPSDPPRDGRGLPMEIVY